MKARLCGGVKILPIVRVTLAVDFWRALGKHWDNVRASPGPSDAAPVENGIKVDRILFPTFEQRTGIFVQTSGYCYVTRPRFCGHSRVRHAPNASAMHHSSNNCKRRNDGTRKNVKSMLIFCQSIVVFSNDFHSWNERRITNLRNGGGSSLKVRNLKPSATKRKIRFAGGPVGASVTGNPCKIGEWKFASRTPHRTTRCIRKPHNINKYPLNLILASSLIFIMV